MLWLSPSGLLLFGEIGDAPFARRPLEPDGCFA
jgi:hypothetical protein